MRSWLGLQRLGGPARAAQAALKLNPAECQ